MKIFLTGETGFARPPICCLRRALEACTIAQGEAMEAKNRDAPDCGPFAIAPPGSPEDAF